MSRKTSGYKKLSDLITSLSHALRMANTFGVAGDRKKVRIYRRLLRIVKNAILVVRDINRATGGTGTKVGIALAAKKIKDMFSRKGGK